MSGISSISVLSEVVKVRDSVKWEFVGGHGEVNAVNISQGELLKQMKVCANHTQSVINHLKLFGFIHKAAFLKIDDAGLLNVIIIVKEADFLNPAFLHIYKYVIALENQAENLTFSFLDFADQSGNINLESDGYHMKLKAD